MYIYIYILLNVYLCNIYIFTNDLGAEGTEVNMNGIAFLPSSYSRGDPRRKSNDR